MVIKLNMILKIETFERIVYRLQDQLYRGSERLLEGLLVELLEACFCHTLGKKSQGLSMTKTFKANVPFVRLKQDFIRYDLFVKYCNAT